MFETLFSSQSPPGELRRRVIAFLEEAAGMASRCRVEIHGMAFSFTDPEIARLLVETARRHDDAMIRLIVDWSQGSPQPGRQAGQLARHGLPNLQVRYKSDQPYRWDARQSRLRWSYHVSRGLLHHKTLGVRVDGVPRKLLCGTFNWTAGANRSYENLLVVTDRSRDALEPLVRMELEFEALWCDGRATLAPAEAAEHYRLIEDRFRRCPGIDPAEVTGLEEGRGGALDRTPTADGPAPGTAGRACGDAGRHDERSALVVFNSRRMDDPASEAGYAAANRGRTFHMRGASGQDRPAPLTLTTLALDVLNRAASGEKLYLAMHGLSPRVPEYRALIDAARRGVRCSVLLDAGVSLPSAIRLAAIQAEESLPLEVSTVGRTMHQKYLVHVESATVLTGTANMSTDATERHSEHRMVVRHSEPLAQAFLRDFEEIRSRLPTSRGPSTWIGRDA